MGAKLTESGAGEERLLRETGLRIEHVEIFAGFRQGTARTRRELEFLLRELGERIYPELLYVLLHRHFDDARDARMRFERILETKRDLESFLKRSVTIQMAALDYAQTEGILPSVPAIIEEAKIAALARDAAGAGRVPVFERDLLAGELHREVERARRYGSRFSVLFADMDDLARVNGAYGYTASDTAVRRVGELLDARTRALDMVFRTGDDEFAVVLPNAEADVARTVAEKLLRAVRETRVVLAGTENSGFRVTVSMGLAAFDPHSVQDVEDVLRAGAVLLEEAKRSGKDRVKMFQQVGPERRIVDMPEKSRMEPRERERFVIRGLPISRGVAMGKVFVHEDILTSGEEGYEIAGETVEQELARMHRAIRHVRNDIERMEKQVRVYLGQEYADIFAVHKFILNDTALINELEEKMRRELVNAEQVVRSVFRRFESRFGASGSEVTRERSADIADLSRRLLRTLAGLDRNIFSRAARNRVVVAKRLLPSESVHLRRGNVHAIVTEKGSRNSHAAILARGMGIPYISEIDYPMEKIPPDSYLIVDANRGEVVVNPDQKERRAVTAAIEVQRRRHREVIERTKRIRLEKDGRRIRVMANVNSEYNIREAAEYGADGIGLYRIEQLYMQSRVFPGQEQLYRVLSELFRDMQDREIVVRLLDIGGDKTLPYVNMSEDIYSFLGLRGVRVLLKYPKILETQLLALLRMSRDYRVKILVPVVTLSEELVAVRNYLARCKRILESEGTAFDRDIRLGSMIEVPAAVVRIDEILQYSDFVSIGTNDLIQYLMASSRENAFLAKYYEAGIDISMSYIQHVLERARLRGVECSLCGEVAADTAYTERLVGLGLDDFSVSPSNIPMVKNRIASVMGIPVPEAARPL